MNSKFFLPNNNKHFLVIPVYLIFGLVFPALGQMPEGIPTEPNPLGLDSVADYLLFIGLPLTILLLLTLWFKKGNGKKNED